MKPISIHVSEDDYEELRSLASRTGKPIAELIQTAMAEFLDQERRDRRSMLDMPAHDSGELRETWTRPELLDEGRG